MNIRMIPALALCLLIMFCSQFDNVYVTKSASATVPGTSQLSKEWDIDFPDFNNLTIIADTALTFRGISRDMVDRAYLQAFTISLIDSLHEQDMTFVERVEFKIQTPSGEPVPLAWGGPFDPGTRTAKLSSTTQNLTQFVQGDSIRIFATFIGRPPENRCDISADLVLMVDANVTGLACNRER